MKKLRILIAAVLFSLVLVNQSSAATLTRQLQIGMRGSDVSDLQSFLAQDRTIYPQGLVTGYFGTLTRSAVSNFQARNGIATVGRVGPITLAAINAQMNSGTSNPAAMISNITVNASTNNALISWYTNESTSAKIYYSPSPLILTETFTDVLVSGGFVSMTDTSFRTYHGINLSNLQSNTLYYYMIYTVDVNGNVTVSWPSTFRTI